MGFYNITIMFKFIKEKLNERRIEKEYKLNKAKAEWEYEMKYHSHEKWEREQARIELFVILFIVIGTFVATAMRRSYE